MKDDSGARRRLLVIGGTSGVGRALVALALEAGWSVHATGRSEKSLARLAPGGGLALSIHDALDDGATLDLDAIAPDGRLDGLAYCPGTIDLMPLARATDADFVRAYRINVVGAARSVAAAAPHLQRASGAVVFFSSVAASQGFANHAVTAAAKGALEALGRSLAAELAPAVRVNTIALSLTRTPLAARLADGGRMEEALARLHPLGRLGEPEDAAAMALFLLSADAGWVTGQTIGVDGGRGNLRGRD